MKQTYLSRLNEGIQQQQSVLCVGIDPDLARIPDFFASIDGSEAQKVLNFCLALIEQTESYGVAYKPNLAFFEALGPQGWSVYEQVCQAVPSTHLVIADAKRGDIGNTAEHYRKGFWEQTRSDAITINPLMGLDALSPFFREASKAIYVLAYTSNPGAQDFLAQPMQDGRKLAVHIAERLAQWQSDADTHLGMVVGATQVAALSEVLEAHPKASLLIPGVGAQGGKVEDLLPLLKKHEGVALVNASRAISYPDFDGQSVSSWQKAVQKQAQQLKNELDPLVEVYV